MLLGHPADVRFAAPGPPRGACVGVTDHLAPRHIELILQAQGEATSAPSLPRAPRRRCRSRRSCVRPPPGSTVTSSPRLQQLRWQAVRRTRGSPGTARPPRGGSPTAPGSGRGSRSGVIVGHLHLLEVVEQDWAPRVPGHRASERVTTLSPFSAEIGMYRDVRPLSPSRCSPSFSANPSNSSYEVLEALPGSTRPGPSC